MAKALKFKKRVIDTTKTREQREQEAIREITDLYRQNPHRLISTELGCETLTWFQDLIIYLAFRSASFFLIAARGIGKSYIIAWIIIALAIVFPRIKIVIASSTKGQARLLVTQKVMGEIYNRYPNVRREIDLRNSSLSQNDTYVTLYNKSQIVCVTSTENSRGNRCAILVLEEDAKININIKNNVLIKFLQNGERVPRYKDNPKFAAFKPAEEKKKQLHITSGEFQKNPVYKECMDVFSHMLGHRDMSQVLLSLHWGFPCAEPFINMSYEDDIKPEMEKSTFIPMFWTQENEGLFVSESQFAMFGYQDLVKLQTIEYPYIPTPHYLFADSKELKAWQENYTVPKKKDEIRVLSIDVAVMGGDNDNTIFMVTTAVPEGNRYTKEIRYIEHASGAHSETQSIRMKQLYYDFDIDVICLDVNGNGMGVADAASKAQSDKERGILYPAFTVFNREDMVGRAYNTEINNSNACIYGIKQTQKLNHHMITYLKSAIESNRISLPLEYHDAVNLYSDKDDLPESIKTEYLKVNVETDFLIKELMALEIRQQSDSPYLKVENTAARKDRFTAAAFANYWIQRQESLLRGEAEDNPIDTEEWYLEL